MGRCGDVIFAFKAKQDARSYEIQHWPFALQDGNMWKKGLNTGYAESIDRYKKSGTPILVGNAEVEMVDLKNISRHREQKALGTKRLKWCVYPALSTTDVKKRSPRCVTSWD